ncbi:MAG: 4Fe-4S binding protein [Bacteroidetes bacterium]|nr:4Fe-4S binding protein [Bacteroidota bacterium]
MQYLVTYIGSIFRALNSLRKGMKLTGYYFTHHKNIVTQQYPENRKEMFIGERFRGEVILTHDANNEHRCTGCSACEIACPNGTIRIISKFEIVPETQKKKKAIDEFVYHLGMCTFCNLCIIACPTDAIVMSHDFEHSTYDRKPLNKILNKPGSKLMKGVEE